MISWKKQYIWPALITGVFMYPAVGCINQHQTKPLTDSITAEKRFANDFIRGYWTGFDYQDTSMIRQLNSRKDVFKNYAKALTAATPDSARASIQHMLAMAESDDMMYYFFCGLFEQYFYHPNSPIRNENLYTTVLQQQLASPSTTAAEKERLSTRLALILKNNPGQKATDFSFVTSDGVNQNLYSLKSDLLLLLFYNPECASCAETIRLLKASAKIKKISVVAIYPDNDTDTWQRHLPNMPSSWINGHDEQQLIKSGHLYDLKAIPTLYLLDGEKRVLLKDADVNTIERFLTKK